MNELIFDTVEKRKRYRRAYFKAHPEKRWKLQYKDLAPEKRLLYAARARAKRRGIEFELEVSDIQIPSHCPYLGLELIHHNPRGEKRDNSISLDRIDNTKGYVKGNVQVISHLANTMKNSASQEQLLKFARKILDEHTDI